MLAETIAHRNVYIVCGYTDMRKSISGLVAVITQQYGLQPDAESLFLFCGKRSDRIKALLWEGDGFLLLYKRIEDGAFSWPQTPDEAAELTREQYFLLMNGLNPITPKIKQVFPRSIY